MRRAAETAQCCEPKVSAAPAMSEWAGLLAARGELGEDAAEFRRELGLPTDRAVVMTGHQTQVWHPGIMAKYLAVDAVSEASGAAAAWLWVDQDVHAPAEIRYPVRLRGAGGGDLVLEERTWLAGGGEDGGDVPTGRRSAFEPGAAPKLESGEEFAAAGVGAGLARIREALARHSGAGSAGEQVARAVGELLTEWARPADATVFSMRISGTALFRRLVRRMREDVRGCVACYQRAVREFPNERVTALSESELPLWMIGAEAGSGRRKVSVEDLAGGDAVYERLAPRALLMTGLMRMAGCDLFVHGTGGGGGVGGHEGYDRITERWLGEWLGARLAPITVATATMHLRVEHAGPGLVEVRRRQWTAHRARHDPAILHDAAAAARKREFVGQIAGVRRAGGDAVPLYKQMHRFLDEVRIRHADELAMIERAAEDAAAHAGDAAIAADRTWAFPLYEQDQLAALAECVRRGARGGA